MYETCSQPQVSLWWPRHPCLMAGALGFGSERARSHVHETREEADNPADECRPERYLREATATPPHASGATSAMDWENVHV